MDKNQNPVTIASNSQDKAVTNPVSSLEPDPDFEPCNGIEFESHEAAYSFYQEYAKSMGFTTSIKNSRRSKKSKEFIDAKFACSRYGVTPESDGQSQTTRRPSVKKTDCKASMHVKRRPDGKWIIHEFVKEHNHELLPALAYHFRIHRNVKLAEKNNIDILHAVSERTRKMFVEMSRKSGGGYEDPGFDLDDPGVDFEKGRYLGLDDGDGTVLFEYFKHVKSENPNFYYVVDLNEEQRLRNVFWVDAKSRSDYVSFNDVVSFDTSYIKNNEKFPFVSFFGVNHHFQPMFLGCALVADESKSAFVWVMKSWLRAMKGKAPRVLITDQDKNLKSAVEEVFPDTRHCFSLWHVLEKLPETLAHVIKPHENFLPKFNKCIFKSWTDEQFDMRWWKMVSRFELHDDEWFRSLYDDRKKWVPTFMGDTFLAGMSTSHRSESMSSFFDKYMHKKITMKEFVKQYSAILQNRLEEEELADFDTLHKQPALRSPSPWEKQMSTIYTHTVFKKFQIEVLGVVGCQPRKELEDETTSTFRVQDCEKEEHYFVVWNEPKTEISCSCHLFEYKGFLCRHALIVLQICGLSSIPSQYILRRWTKDAKGSQSADEETERVKTRVQRYNELCKWAIELCEEGSVSEERHNIAFRALVEALKSCVNVNNSIGNAAESSGHFVAISEAEEENQGSHGAKTGRKKYTNRKRKVQPDPATILVEPQDTVQQMDTMNEDGMALNGYFGGQQNVQGLLNLMEPPHESYYVNPPSMQGLGQLNSMPTGHDSYFGSQQSIHGLAAQLDFRQQNSFNYSLQDDSRLRSTQLHGSGSRHA